VSVTAPGIVKYPNVFSPIKLGPVEIPNRIYMAPHGIPLEVPSEGLDTAREPAENRVHYFGERAAGGVGLIIHSTQISPFTPQANLGETPGLERSIPSFRRVADAVHAHGSKILGEIWYVNWLQKQWEKLGPEAPGLAPSVTQNLYYPGVRREMTKYEIGRMKDAYADSARNLREAGYDGIELHVSHGSLIEYFLTPYFNRRTDEYGGSLENRARMLLEVLEAIRGEMTDEHTVGLRINADEMLKGGLDEEGTKEALAYVVATGLTDFVDLDVSVEPEQAHLMTTGMFDPVMHNAARVARVRESCGSLPILATPGRVTSIADAEKLLTDGVTDMVGAVRGLIAEPEMVNKSKEGRERERRICVAVNACVDPLGVGWGCAINPVAGREHRWGAAVTEPVANPMKVVVVGGGPAGLEAARIAATRGNQVTLLERRDQVGGGVAIWGELPGRQSMKSLVNYFAGRMADLGVDVKTGIDADVGTVLALEPDAVVVATGSRYNRGGSSGFAPPPIPGAGTGLTVSPEEVIAGDVDLSGKVLILDDEGYHTASGIAELAAAAGGEVTYVTRKQTVAASLGIAIGYIAGRLRSAGVTVKTGTYVKEIRKDSVTVFDVMSQEESVVDGLDAVVLATMRDPLTQLHAELEERVPYAYLVGDALAPRGLREATYEGHRFGRVIGDEEMPASVSEAIFGVEESQTLRRAAEAEPVS
jgi:2,4-dienoyl-CoA reductase-like NADH-dependent reductase (Old Yellow Enzyme family)/thioredoxin reductase